MLKLSGVDGCPIHVETEGAGAPLVLISGLSGSADFWTPLRPLLAVRHQLILFDHAGTGRSGSRCHHTIAALADDVRLLLDQLEIERAHLLGHSTGGAVAQCLALDSPQRVDRLVISGSWSRPDDRFNLLFETRLAVLERAGQAVSDAFGQLLAFPPQSWEATSFSQQSADQRSSQAAAARMRMLLDFDRQDEISAIAIPTMILASPDDYIVPLYLSRKIAQAIRGARFVEISGGHFFPRTQPKAVAEAVLEFLAEAE